MKAEKLLSVAAIVLALLICAVLGVIVYLSLDLNLRADRLFESGDYTAAREVYRKAHNTRRVEVCDEMILENRYLDARRVLQNGNYKQARALLLALGDYKDCANLVMTCDAMEAAESAKDGDPERALEIYLSLGDYPGAERGIAELREPLYNKALELAKTFELDRACAIWTALGDYRDASTLLRRGENMRSLLRDEARIPLCDPSRKILGDMNDRVYVCDDAYLVFPEKADSETRFFLYYPGGRDEELYVEYFFSYLNNPAPNTLAVFLRRNGLPDPKRMSTRAAELLDEAAADCGVFANNVLVAGSSLGVYPALHSLLVLPRDYALHVPCFLSLDAGNDWQETALLLSRAECRELAEYGTVLYLFESPWVGMDRSAIREMVNAGNIVWLVGCLRDEHAQITFDALSNGMVDWALGDRSGRLPSQDYLISRFVPDE